MLEVMNVSTYYGNACALHDAAFQLNAGEIVSIIGANGAGKSTLMKTIMGVVHTRSGRITLDGKEITHLPTHRIVHEGIVYVPEGRDVFTALSVQDNLLMGSYSQKISKKELESRIDQMYDMFPRLRERRRQLAGTLSGGEQQMLAITRGLMSHPRIIMFDEPSLGLAPVIVDEVFEQIRNIRDRMGISVILVEQNAFMALDVSDRTYVLENGVIVQSGRSADLINDPGIKSAYLGM